MKDVDERQCVELWIGLWRWTSNSMEEKIKTTEIFIDLKKAFHNYHSYLIKKIAYLWHRPKLIKGVYVDGQLGGLNDEKLMTFEICIDLKKAFDTIDQLLPIKKKNIWVSPALG